MRTTIVDGIAYRCPMYVVRAGDGWQVRLPGLPTAYFADSRYGGVAGSFRAAVRARAQAGPITDETRPLMDAERPTKLRPTGIPGVFLQFHRKHGKRSDYYSLAVRTGQQGRTFYVGTRSTWEAAYPRKLALAAAERQAQVWRRARSDGARA